MSMDFPKDHLPKFANFQIDGILDETLREGSERCMFSIQTENKIPLIRKILQSGVKDIIFGSGPNDPIDMAHVIEQMENEGVLTDQKFSFILLLNCFEPLMTQFKNLPQSVKKHITISFGMITHDTENSLFEKTVDRFKKIGFDNFRVSLLNNFSSEIDEKTYKVITNQIDRSRAKGINVIRINDSLGTIYPETMSILAANLRHDYPTTNFCLHAHNDRGFGLQNALNSIYHGFNMIEGGFAGFGNRSGLPAIELLNLIFKEKNISIASGDLETDVVFECASLAEEVFLVIPDLFRPLSGKNVDCENMGVTNIPDYLGSGTASRYFLNKIGLHKPTLEKLFRELKVDDDEYVSLLAYKFRVELEKEMFAITVQKSVEYRAMQSSIERFYDEDVFYSERVVALAKDFLTNQSKFKFEA